MAAEHIAGGEIIIMAFNGIFVIVGDADDCSIPQKIAALKGRSVTKGVALVCPPEYLAEFINHEALAARGHVLERILPLYKTIYALGIILPAALPNTLRHVIQVETILNVWTEYPPHQPIRHLVNHLRKFGKRALVGTSANLSGQPSICDPDQVMGTFQKKVALMLLDSFDRVPLAYRRSTSIISFAGQTPRLHREGSVSREVLQGELTRLGLGPMVIGPEAIKV